MVRWDDSAGHARARGGGQRHGVGLRSSPLTHARCLFRLAAQNKQPEFKPAEARPAPPAPVLSYKDAKQQEDQARDRRVKLRADRMLQSASLPPRMELYQACGRRGGRCTEGTEV